MLRRIVALLALLVVGAVFIACVVALVHSHRHGATMRWYRTPADLEIISSQGILSIAAGTTRRSDYPPPAGWSGTIAPFNGRFSVGGSLWKDTFAGFHIDRWEYNTSRTQMSAVIVRIPWYALVLLSGSLLAFAIYRHARRTTHANACPSCGYDLRATPERCPECGRGTRLDVA